MTRSFFCSLIVSGLALIVLGTSARAETLSIGQATIDLDSAAWASVAGGANISGLEALILDEHFDAAASESRTGSQILNDEVQSTPSYVNQVYAMNSDSVNNLAGRFSQPTTFSFMPTDLPVHQGHIGLGGVTRWQVNPLLGGGSLLFGDYTLQYDPLRIGSNSGFPLNGSGWYLKANIPPAGAAFDIMNVSLSANNDTFSLSGDLAVSYEVAVGLYRTPGDQGKDVGDLTFSARIVPEPQLLGLTSAWLLACGRRALRTQRQRSA